jgi:hypothetical protein
MHTAAARTARLGAISLALLGLFTSAAAQTRPPAPVRMGDDGRLAYTPDPQGNKIIDFSTAGYGGGDPIPLVPARIVVEPDGKNDRARIQAALDLVAAMPAGPDGFRGAVLLKPGRYLIDTHLTLNASGVVLRGSGAGEDGTVLTAVGQSRRTLIEIGGRGDRTEIPASRKNVTDPFVPVGATQLTVDDAAPFPVGARILIRRPCTPEWIAQLAMGSFSGWTQNPLSWRPNSRDILWERTVTALNGNTLTVDAPITTALDKTLGVATVSRFDFPGRIDHVGVENLRCISEYTPGAPTEEHAWCCVSLDTVENAWVRQLTARQFVGYVVITHPDSRRITIEDVSAQAPISELAGYRRRVFSIGGELTLVQRCDSSQGLHDFTTGFAAAGPNVFLNCRATDALDFSGPLESWASGILYDNVVIRGNALRFLNRGANGQGAGWTAANSLFWNCESTDLQVQSPPGAQNYAFGCKGIITDDNLTFDPRIMPLHDWVGSGAKKPDSLYLQQLAERKGPDAPAKLTRAAIPTSTEGIRLLAAADVPPPPAPKPLHPLKVENAHFTIDGQPAFTSQTNWSWYLGQTPRNLARPAGVAITRFLPGTSGMGQTDRLEDVIASLKPGGAFVHHYGLWYDRRRINHNFYGAPEFRADEVSAPFMEQPWARSGQGTDWDGLSKYDLTQFNPWFFSRVKDFADLCDTSGRILYYNFYFQHPLQETRAHYVDFPWRPVNCLQATDLPDENPAGSTFYDVSHPVRRDLHRLYIRHSLDVLKDNANVVYGIDREFSGPLSFVQFWLDTIAEWEKENNKKVFITLEVPKAEMDTLLNDPVRRPMITAVTFFNWNYRPDGSLFAIEGGINKAPREQLQAQPQAGRAGRGGPGGAAPGARGAARGGPRGGPGAGGAAGAELRYRAYREYRDAFPDLILLSRNDDFPGLSAAIDKTIPAAARAQLRPAPIVHSHPESTWAMAAPGKAYLLYSMAGDPIDLDLSNDPAPFTLSWLDSTNGELRPASSPITAGQPQTLTPPPSDTKHPWIAWLTRP